jgi:hypothetical protein
MYQNNDFKKTFLWDSGHRFCKLQKKMSKKGTYYYQGTFDNFLLVGNEVTYQEKTYIDLKFIPVKYEKITAAKPETKPQPKPSPAPEEEFSAQYSGDVPY